MHDECMPKKLITTQICSKVCEMKLLVPFASMSNDEFLDELTFNYPSCESKSNAVSPTTEVPTVDSNPRPTLLSEMGPHDKNLRSSCEDSFNQVYCEYISQNDVPDLMSTGDPRSISIFHSNVISLKKNLSGVEEIFTDCKNYPSIIAISETGLDGDIDSEHVSLDGYHKIERSDSLISKGGVGIYVADQLDYESRDDLKLKAENCEDIWLEIQARPHEKQERKIKDKPFVVGEIYHHPDQPFRSFSYKICQTIEKLSREKTNFMIVGDINIY